jgi:hypothetical protein
MFKKQINLRTPRNFTGFWGIELFLVRFPNPSIIKAELFTAEDVISSNEKLLDPVWFS